MLSPGGKEEPQGAVYQGVEDDMDDSKGSLKVPWALGGRDGSGARARAALRNSASCVQGFLARCPGTRGRRARRGGRGALGGPRGRVSQVLPRPTVSFVFAPGFARSALVRGGHLRPWGDLPQRAENGGTGEVLQGVGASEGL